MRGSANITVFSRSWLGLLVVALGMLTWGGAATGDDDDIVNSGGFELPFTTVFGGTGRLEGQLNPPGEGQVLPPGCR